MATSYLLKVHYHYEQNGKKSSPEYIDTISVTATDAATIKSKLSGSNPGSLVIDAVSNVGTGTAIS